MQYVYAFFSCYLICDSDNQANLFCAFVVITSVQPVQCWMSKSKWHMARDIVLKVLSPSFLV
jgi:hypothetical protein